MNILLTGTNGLVGHSLVRQLSPTHALFSIEKRTLAEDILPSVTSIGQDLSVGLDYSRLPSKVDAVIHLAQSLRFREFPDAVEDIFSVNTHATVRLAEYARQANAKCFIFASTGGVYASSDNRLMENGRVAPSNFYAATKYAAELLISNYAPFMRVVILRFFFVYGPRQRNMLIPNLVEKVIKGMPVVIDGNPGLSINPIYVDDAVRVFEPLLSQPFNGVFNVAGDEVVTMTGLVNEISSVCGQKPIIQYRDSNPSAYLIGDNSRMKNELGVTPFVPLHDGLQQMVRAFQ